MTIPGGALTDRRGHEAERFGYHAPDEAHAAMTNPEDHGEHAQASASGAAGVPPVLATAFAAVIGTVLLSFHWTVGKSFGAMFADFGNHPESLPLPTRVAIGPWCPVGLGLVVLGLAFAGAQPERGRRAATVAAIALGLAALAGLLWGVYLPIFELAGKIKSWD